LRYLDLNDSIHNILFNGDYCQIYSIGTKFHKVILNGDGRIYGNNIFDTLTFSAGSSYFLDSWSNQIVNDHFSALGNGCFPITIQSITSGSQSIITKSSGDVVCGYLELRDQKAMGGATFYAGVNSSNVSNNSGWNFTDGPGYIYGFPKDSSFCQGDTLLLTTEYFYGGTSYQWQDGSTNSFYKVTEPGTYWVQVKYSNNCLTADTIHITQKSKPVATATSNSPVCSGDVIQLSGSGGSSYLWTGPGGYSSVVQNPQILNSVTTNSGKYFLVVGNDGCKSKPDSAEVFVTATTSVSISVTAAFNPVCSGTAVTFTSSPANGGLSPVYQWKVNGNNTGLNMNTYNYTPVDGDIVTCVLTSSADCITGSPATSPPVIMTVDPMLPVSLTIDATSNPVCAGTLVTFTPAPVHAGIPAYQWFVNGGLVSTASVWSYVPVNGDQVYAIMTSTLSCISGSPATSNTITMNIDQPQPVTVSITASPNPVCAGTTVAFTATPGNGGISPAYQWQVNGLDQSGAINSTYTYIPMNHDVITCVLTSDKSCVYNNPKTSNSVMMITGIPPQVSYTPCADTKTTTNAQPFQLKGGLPPGGTWSGPGVSSGIFNPAIAGAGIKTMTYSYTNIYSCNNSVTFQIQVITAQPFTCGSSLIDIRDGQAYPTVLLADGKCWMAANLNYGTGVIGTLVQSDNCVAEKYCLQDDFLKCNTYGGMYQWDELMQYNITSRIQGLCPPGWHIPESAEWDAMIVLYDGAGLAGSFLKDSLLLNGFNSLSGGLNYLNSTWSFYNGLYKGAMYWTSTITSTTGALARGLNQSNPGVLSYPSSRANSFSVRCMKN